MSKIANSQGQGFAILLESAFKKVPNFFNRFTFL